MLQLYTDKRHVPMSLLLQAIALDYTELRLAINNIQQPSSVGLNAL